MRRSERLDRRGRDRPAVPRGRTAPAWHPRAARDVRVRMGTTVQSISQSDGIVHVHLSDKTERHVDLLVGADGIRSQVRALCFEDTPPRYVGQMYWRTALRAPVVDQPTMMFD